jgi:hypothetical protein
MKAAFTLTLVATTLALGALAATGGTASAQTRPEAQRGEPAPTQRAQPSDRLPGPQRSDEQAPRDEAPSAQDRAPPMPGCQDQGRKLELIV